MKIKATQLITDLSQMVHEDIAQIKKLESLPLSILNLKQNAETWSILENLEHLNLYGDFYIPAIEAGMAKGAMHSPSEQFQSNWLGEYFAKAMLPKADGSIF